jgi:hypothetical protein
MSVQPGGTGRGRRTAAIIVAGGALLRVGLPAQAGVVYELQPTVAVGVTDNATNTAPPNPRLSDEFGTVAGTARARLRKVHADHSLGYRLSETSYLHGRGATILSQELAWLSDFTPSVALDLRLGLSASYSRTSNPVGLDVNGAPQSAQLGLDTALLSSTATEELRYQASLRTRLLEGLRASGVRYLLPSAAGNPAAQPQITSSYAFGGLLRGERDFGRNVLSLQLEASDTRTAVSGPGTLPDQALFVQALAGWRRDLSLTWFAELQAGALEVFDFHGTNIVEPAGAAALSYRRIEWFASLTASQAATSNLFIGAVTISDQVSARLALPLSRSQRTYLLGYGGYTYARFADREGTRRAYELRAAGASFTARGQRLPIWASLEYTISSQLGTEGVNGAVPDIRRQVVMLTVGGAFVLGPGTPSVFHGLLPAILPLGDRATGRADDPSGNVENVTR